MKLKSGDKLLVDFDGTIVENQYPAIGPILPGIKSFLDKCKEKNIEIWIWSARCNPIPDGYTEKDTPSYGKNAMLLIEDFMKTNELYFTGFHKEYKPIHLYHYQYLVDDKSVFKSHGLEYNLFFFGEA